MSAPERAGLFGAVLKGLPGCRRTPESREKDARKAVVRTADHRHEPGLTGRPAAKPARAGSIAAYSIRDIRLRDRIVAHCVFPDELGCFSGCDSLSHLIPANCRFLLGGVTACHSNFRGLQTGVDRRVWGLPSSEGVTTESDSNGGPGRPRPARLATRTRDQLPTR